MLFFSDMTCSLFNICEKVPERRMIGVLFNFAVFFYHARLSYHLNYYFYLKFVPYILDLYVYDFTIVKENNFFSCFCFTAKSVAMATKSQGEVRCRDRAVLCPCCVPCCVSLIRNLLYCSFACFGRRLLVYIFVNI